LAVKLLERDRELAALDALLDQIAAGQGRIALISGEAGIGKTALVERFLAQAQARRHHPVRFLWGACEALFTPRPLGPLYDIASQAQRPLRTLLGDNAPRAILFAAVLEELTHSAVPTVVVVDDIHWADEATLDLLKYLARRIRRTAALLILMYRDDELSRDHPLRYVFGDFPAHAVTRLRLFPLSEAAVAALSDGRSPIAPELYRTTGGNPFFLTEALASETPGVPASVSDAVLARVARRSPEARHLLNLVAVVPTRMDRWLVKALHGESGTVLEECLTANLLRLDGEAVAFRHELARQAVEDALALTQRRALHAQVAQALLDRGERQVSLAQLVHHAIQAEDGILVLRFAPAAARQASAQGAHREAVEYYRAALRYADGLDPLPRAELLDGLSSEQFLIGSRKEATVSCEEALTLWNTVGDVEQTGHDLRRLSRLNWYLGKNTEAERFAIQAVAVLETLPPGRELAMAYANLSNLYMVQGNTSQTLVWGEHAIALAEQLRDAEPVCSALNSIGTAELEENDEQGWSKLERSLRIALEHGYEDHVARAYANLSANALRRRKYADAVGYIEHGMAYCAEHDLDAWKLNLWAHQARVRLDQGDWAGATDDATAILSFPVPREGDMERGPALLVLGQVRARRGDPGVDAMLDEAHDLPLSIGAMRTGVMDSYVAVAAARAEWRWLQGNREGSVAEAEAGYQMALEVNGPWYCGEVAIWLWRAGALRNAPAKTLPPYSLEIAGDWHAAAAAWEELGCPYEQAMALLEGDELAQRTALMMFERLGARPGAEIARKRLRASGARGLPRGPRPATQANPAGLTSRQLEILLLLTEGLHTSEIAVRLSTTSKTIEHHVSNILTKLDVHSRAEAVRWAYESALIPSPASQSATAQGG
jgi:DNA-binding CsgD family transcriptional regulator/tetratricopeptide (TPR) repeat protein